MPLSVTKHFERKISHQQRLKTSLQRCKTLYSNSSWRLLIVKSATTRKSGSYLLLTKAPHNKIEYHVPTERQMKPVVEGCDCSNDETVSDRWPPRFYLHNKLCNNCNLLKASISKLLVTMRDRKKREALKAIAMFFNERILSKNHQRRVLHQNHRTQKGFFAQGPNDVWKESMQRDYIVFPQLYSTFSYCTTIYQIGQNPIHCIALPVWSHHPPFSHTSHRSLVKHLSDHWSTGPQHSQSC